MAKSLGDVEKLIKQRTFPEEPPIYYVTIENAFDVIRRAHVATGHGGRDRMLKALCPKYMLTSQPGLGNISNPFTLNVKTKVNAQW